jgi:O-antigen/teichoic acid export membrane protein
MNNKEDATDSTLGDRTKQSIVWSTTLPLAAHSARFLNSLILARILSPTDFGVMGMVFVIMYYANTFTDFGFAKAIVQKPSIHNLHYRSYFTFNFLISAFLFSALQLSAVYIETYFNVDDLAAAIQVYSFFLIISALAAPAKVKLRRAIRFKSLAIAEAFQVGVSIPISLGLALHGYGFWAIVYAGLCSQSLMLFFLCWSAGIVPWPTARIASLRSLISFGKWDFLAGQVNLVAESVDKLIIGKVLGASAVGLYDRALGLGRMPYEQVSGKFSNVAFSTFSRYQHSRQDLIYYMRRISVLNALVLAPMMLGLAAIADEFVLVVLGETWVGMTSTLQVLCVSFIFAGVGRPFYSINIAAGWIAEQTLINLVLVTLLVVAMLYMAERGIDAVAFVILVYQFLYLVISVWLTRKKFEVALLALLAPMLQPIVLAGGMYWCVFYLKSMIEFENAALELVTLIASGGLVFALLVLVAPLRELAFVRKKIRVSINNLIGSNAG